MIDLTHLHPMIVHFPIALLIVGFGFELVGLFVRKDFLSIGAFVLLLLGTAGVVAAYLSGDAAGEGLAEGGALKQAIEDHEHAAQLTLWLAVATAIIRTLTVILKKFSGYVRYIPAALFLVTVLSIARTGHFGGQLVYKHAAGVQLSIGDSLGSGSTSSGAAEEDKD